MNSKYIFFFCFAMSYLVIQSVARGKGIAEGPKGIHEAYTKTREHFKIGVGEKLSMDQLMWLMDTDGKSIINKNFTAKEIAAMQKNKISLDELVKIIKKICKNNHQQVSDFMKRINKQLNDKLSAIAVAV